jgi:hypothetical protein
VRFVKKTHFFCIFFSKKFAHIKKKYYLCTRFQKGDHETPKRNPKKGDKIMARFNLMLLKKGKKRFCFERQFFSRIFAETEGERIIHDSYLCTFFVSYKVIATNKKRFF